LRVYASGLQPADKVEEALEAAQAPRVIEKVTVFTGRGRHSRGALPLLRPLVLRLLEEKGVKCALMAKNIGIVQAFVGGEGTRKEPVVVKRASELRCKSSSREGR
jgi:hypothetical protein